MGQTGGMGEERTTVTCEDCFFRRAQLCALPANQPCPTFRPARAPSGERLLSATQFPERKTRIRAVAAA